MTQKHYLISDMRVGYTRTYERTVTQADLETAMTLTGDYGGYHTDAAFARKAGFREVIVPGMFQAGLVTRIGGEFNLLAREMTFRFSKPVYVGDQLTVTIRIAAVDTAKNRIDLEGGVTNERGEEVLSVRGFGYLPRTDWGIPAKPTVDVEPTR